MKKLGNKGITTMEILISFVLVSIISASIYVTVSNFNTRSQYESNNLEMSTYKNLLTKTIQDDFVKIGIVDANKLEKREGHKDVYIIDVDLKDKTKRRIVVQRQLANDASINNNSDIRDYDDQFMVYYGTPSNYDINASNYTQGLIEYPVPDFGFSYNKNEELDGSKENRKVYDLRLTNVRFDVKNQVVSIYIGFNHTALGIKYAINISAPMSY